MTEVNKVKTSKTNVKTPLEPVNEDHIAEQLEIFKLVIARHTPPYNFKASIVSECSIMWELYMKCLNEMNKRK